MSDDQRRGLTPIGDDGIRPAPRNQVNPRVTRGLAWLDHIALGPREDQMEEMADQGDPSSAELPEEGKDWLRHLYPLPWTIEPSIWDSEEFRHPYDLFRGSLAGRLQLAMGNSQFWPIGIDAPVSKESPSVFRTGALDTTPIERLEAIPMLSSYRIQAVDATGIAANPGGIWSGATGHITRYLQPFSHLLALSLENSGATDHDIGYLRLHSQLQYLNLAVTAVTDDGLSSLAYLPKLRYLSLAGDDGVTGLGLRYLESLRYLRHLYLNYTGVSDADIICLRVLSDLRILDLLHSKITRRGVTILYHHLPLTKIIY